MRNFRRAVACLLMLLLPLPLWAAPTHCGAGMAHTAPAMAGHEGTSAHSAHDTHHTHSADAADIGHNHALDHEGSAPDGGDHVAPCCGAVLPAPTWGALATPHAGSHFPLVSAAFVSLTQTPLKRPPRLHSL